MLLARQTGFLRSQVIFEFGLPRLIHDSIGCRKYYISWYNNRFSRCWMPSYINSSRQYCRHALNDWYGSRTSYLFTYRTSNWKRKYLWSKTILFIIQKVRSGNNILTCWISLLVQEINNKCSYRYCIDLKWCIESFIFAHFAHSPWYFKRSIQWYIDGLRSINKKCYDTFCIQLDHLSCTYMVFCFL